ncbi:MAG: four helix bundle protein [Ignavibacteriaceae bacterium]
MKDGLEELRFYKTSLELWDLSWNDSEILQKDFRGKEIAKQLIRYFLRIARGSARESKGWYQRSKFLLTVDTINERCNTLDGIIAMITKSIETLEDKKK